MQRDDSEHTAHLDGLIHHGVDFHARREPGRPAIVDGQRILSYHDLAAAMGRLAATLRSVGVQRTDRVGILIDNSLEATVALLGALRSGGCYVPLNPAFPPERLAMILADAEPSAIVTIQSHLPTLVAACNQGTRPLAILVMDTQPDLTRPENLALTLQGCQILGSQNIAQSHPDPEPESTTPEDLAYILYTSGTTGQPKGVMVTHHNVTTFLRWAVDYFALGPGDRFANHSSIGFDLSVFDLFGCFSAGGSLHPLGSAADRAFPGRFIQTHALTIWFSVPSVIGMLRKTRQLVPNAFNTLRHAIFCGEALAPEYAAAWLATHPGVPLHNLYGPTEATIACTCFQVGGDQPFDPQARIPIGRPCRGSEVLVLALDQEREAPIGTVGRLLLGGDQVARGYWHRPELTKKSFRQIPRPGQHPARMYETGDLALLDHNGILHYVGRQDTQVKIMGYRVELSEIEVAVTSLPAVHEGVVIHLPEGHPALVAVVATGPGQDPDQLTAEILAVCERRLPGYMVPGAVRLLPELPKNQNGKIDRTAIRKLIAPPSPDSGPDRSA